VFVQPSTYGRDNACMVDAMKALGSNVRGIVDIDENTSEAELTRLHQAGVRGVRINAGPPNRPVDSTLMAKVVPRLTAWTRSVPGSDGSSICLAPTGCTRRCTKR